jgi:hypothetical protein
MPIHRAISPQEAETQALAGCCTPASLILGLYPSFNPLR